MKQKTKIIFSVLTLVSVLVLSGCGCKQTNKQKYSLSLEIWGFDDEEDVLQPIIENYQKLNPNIKQINYRKLTVDTYKKEIVDALAAGQGPDIFLIHNTWLPYFQDKITPASVEVINEQQYRSNFIDVAAADFISDGKIYGMPLSIDSLGLYYNKDLFNEAGITSPPETWDEFITDVQRLTKINESGQIYQSGASLGTSASNINRATDILNMLFIQRGFSMPAAGGESSANISAGENAVDFYTQFANSASPNYSWNNYAHYSIDAFAEGNLAMMFNYSWHVKTISAKSPKLNFAVTTVPQIQGNALANYANYWAFTVAKNKIINPNADGSASRVTNDIRIYEAWKFLTYLTTAPQSTPVTQAAALASASGGSSVSAGFDAKLDPAGQYIIATNKPSARRDIIEAQKTDPVYGAFAQGNLIAKSWAQKDPENVETILNSMIVQINRGQSGVRDALETALQRIKLSQE